MRLYLGPWLLRAGWSMVGRGCMINIVVVVVTYLPGRLQPLLLTGSRPTKPQECCPAERHIHVRAL